MRAVMKMNKNCQDYEGIQSYKLISGIETRERTKFTYFPGAQNKIYKRKNKIMIDFAEIYTTTYTHRINPSRNLVNLSSCKLAEELKA